MLGRGQGHCPQRVGLASVVQSGSSVHGDVVPVEHGLLDEKTDTSTDQERVYSSLASHRALVARRCEERPQLKKNQPMQKWAKDWR